MGAESGEKRERHAYALSDGVTDRNESPLRTPHHHSSIAEDCSNRDVVHPLTVHKVSVGQVRDDAQEHEKGRELHVDVSVKSDERSLFDCACKADGGLSHHVEVTKHRHAE